MRTVHVDAIHVEVAIGCWRPTPFVIGEGHTDGVRSGPEPSEEGKVFPLAGTVQGDNGLRGRNLLAIDRQNELSVPLPSIFGQMQGDEVGCNRGADRVVSAHSKSGSASGVLVKGRVGVGLPVI